MGRIVKSDNELSLSKYIERKFDLFKEFKVKITKEEAASIQASAADIYARSLIIRKLGA